MPSLEACALCKQEQHICQPGHSVSNDVAAGWCPPPPVRGRHEQRQAASWPALPRPPSWGQHPGHAPPPAPGQTAHSYSLWCFDMRFAGIKKVFANLAALPSALGLVEGPGWHVAWPCTHAWPGGCTHLLCLADQYKCRPQVWQVPSQEPAVTTASSF